jgi:flavin reductase (DIM6/NTAB) family NADH-FMN oxidoreductase RutF
MVGLITTRSSQGDNVMTAEWTYLVSFDPMQVAVVVGPRKATHAAIVETGEFGVSLAAHDQNALSSFAGGVSRRETAKLTSQAFATRPAEVIAAPLIEGTVAQMECKLVGRLDLGDHTIFVGEVVAGSTDGAREPLLLLQGYRRIGERIPRGDKLVVALTPAGEGQLRADAFWYAGEREGKAVEFEATDAHGNRIASGHATTDRSGWAEWTFATADPEGVVVHARCSGTDATATGARLRPTG